jgi:ferric-dicitrate binding protein FerR (iron transport regulator)
MESEEKKIDYNILLKYFKDRANQEEADLITQWIKEPDSGYRCEKCLHLLWAELEKEEKGTEEELELLLDKIHHTIHLKSARNTELKTRASAQNPRMSVNLLFRNLGRIAAIFLVPIMAFTGWETYSQRMWVKNQTEVVYNKISCPLAAQSQFELPDGTKGYLNNGSSLRYPVKFTGKSREVELLGEAFFDVRHDKQRPFIVKTVGLDVKVLGTRLNIHSYPNDDYQEITVESGSVELVQREQGREIIVAEMQPGQHAVFQFGDHRSASPRLDRDQNLIEVENNEQLKDVASTLNPGKEAIYRLDEGDLYLKKEETKYYTGWTDGKLILRNDPMPILLKRIERWYSVSFNIEDERINEYTYWATFTQETLDQVLELLSLTGPIQFQKRPRETLSDGTHKTQVIDVSIK